jgi:hypothetical protein
MDNLAIRPSDFGDLMSLIFNDQSPSVVRLSAASDVKPGAVQYHPAIGDAGDFSLEFPKVAIAVEQKVRHIRPRILYIKEGKYRSHRWRAQMDGCAADYYSKRRRGN